MAEVTTESAFAMHGAREVLAADAVYIEQQVRAIERAVIENPGLAFDLAKTLIESSCKTILTERGHACDDAWDLPKLFRETLSRLRLVPDGCDGEAQVTASLKKTIGGLQTVIHGICELRNAHGFASHGKDAYSRQLEQVQALLVARSADTVVNFLFGAHRHYPSTEPTRRLAYDDHPLFNNYVDEVNDPVRIFDLKYRPSEALFHVDQEAYRDKLANYDAEEGSGDAAVTQGQEDVT